MILEDALVEERHLDALHILRADCARAIDALALRDECEIRGHQHRVVQMLLQVRHGEERRLVDEPGGMQEIALGRSRARRLVIEVAQCA